MLTSEFSSSKYFALPSLTTAEMPNTQPSANTPASLPVQPLTVDSLLTKDSRWDQVERGRSYVAQWTPRQRQSIILGNALSFVADAAAREAAIRAMELALVRVGLAGPGASAEQVLKELMSEYAALKPELYDVSISPR